MRRKWRAIESINTLRSIAIIRDQYTPFLWQVPAGATTSAIYGAYYFQRQHAFRDSTVTRGLLGIRRLGLYILVKAPMGYEALDLTFWLGGFFIFRFSPFFYETTIADLIWTRLSGAVENDLTVRP